MEVLSLGLEVTSARVVSQARGTRAQVSGRRDDEGRLDRILELPDFFGHPAGRRTLIEADLAVEGVHRLVLHFPARVGAFDDVDDAGLVPLVGIVIHRDAVTEIVEGDFFRITEAEVHDFEIGSIRLKAENGTAITRVVFLAFLRDDIETTVADGTPHAAVVADGKAVHVVARKGDTHPETILQDLALSFGAILLRVLQHPDARDTGEVDIVVPRHHPGTRAVEDVVELLIEHLRLGEDPVALLVGQEADLLRLRGHPLKGLLAGPLLVQGQAVSRGLGRQVIVIPKEVVAVVLDAEAEAMGLRDIQAAVIGKSDGRRRGHARFLMTSSDLERRTRRKGRAAFARHTDEVVRSLRLRTAARRELRLVVGRKQEVVSRDEAPTAHFAIDHTDHALLTLELSDIPDDFGQRQAVLADGFADNLAVDEQLHRRLAGMIAARHEEPKERVREQDVGRGQRTGRGVTAMARGDQGVAAIITELTIHAIDLASHRREAKGRARRLPAVEAVAFKGLDDLDVGLQGSGADKKGCEQERCGPHGYNGESR